MSAGLTLSLAAAAVLACDLACAADDQMLGFAPAAAPVERALEARFDANLSAEAMRRRLELMAAEPNQVGAPHDKANAEYTLQQFREWGWDAHIETFQVLYPTPREQSLTLLGDRPFAATLTEPPIPGDPSTARQDGGLPAYLAFGGEGDVTAPLVYVNYGMPADYEALRRLGVDVKGKIVVVRYGGGWRGLKPKLAFEHGAVGCVIYSDPADDGYGAGDPYPKGPERPEHGLQRGSVMDITARSGDPLTPNIGAVEGAPRIAREKAETILKIPAVPISWGDAVHFLAPLGGPVAPKFFRGALPITYHVGGDGPTARLVVRSDWNMKPLYDVIAIMPGAREPDQWVIRGNHRDGWVFGAEDPLSGQISLMEEAKSLGLLAKSGWRPARTIIYASWDGEEAGLLGSTEWAEAHAEDLKLKGVVYINSDGNNRGILGVEASYALRDLIDGAAADVVDPETKASVRDRAVAAIEVRAAGPEANAELKARARDAHENGRLPIGDMGSGSDYTPFVQHLGVASINIGFGGEGSSGGVYHSAYDTFTHFETFGDPGFAYEVALAEMGGRLVLRAADADLAPFDFVNVARTFGLETDELEKMVADKRAQAATVDRLLDRKAFALAADPTLPWGVPEREEPVPALDFAPMRSAVARLKASAQAYGLVASKPAPAGAREAVDAILQQSEQALTDPRGLPGRPWYVNLAYAPGVLTGYGAKTLPGVREAIESARWTEAREYILRTTQALNALSDRVDAATHLLSP